MEASGKPAITTLKALLAFGSEKPSPQRNGTFTLPLESADDLCECLRSTIGDENRGHNAVLLSKAFLSTKNQKYHDIMVAYADMVCPEVASIKQHGLEKFVDYGGPFSIEDGAALAARLKYVRNVNLDPAMIVEARDRIVLESAEELIPPGSIPYFLELFQSFADKGAFELVDYETWERIVASIELSSKYMNKKPMSEGPVNPRPAREQAAIDDKVAETAQTALKAAIRFCNKEICDAAHSLGGGLSFGGDELKLLAAHGAIARARAEKPNWSRLDPAHHVLAAAESSMYVVQFINLAMSLYNTLLPPQMPESKTQSYKGDREEPEMAQEDGESGSDDREQKNGKKEPATPTHAANAESK